FVVESVAEKPYAALKKAGAVQLSSSQIEALAAKAFDWPKPGGKATYPTVSRDFVGRDAAVLAKAIGLEAPPATELLFGETAGDQVFVEEEQMMPFLRVVRVRDVDAAIEAALHAEHGYRHTAMIHSLNIRNLTK